MKKMNYFEGLYTFIEIAIHNNIPQNDMKKLVRFVKNKQKEKIEENFPQLAKFIPDCDWDVIQ